MGIVKKYKDQGCGEEGAGLTDMFLQIRLDCYLLPAMLNSEIKQNKAKVREIRWLTKQECKDVGACFATCSLKMNSNQTHPPDGGAISTALQNSVW